jgi:MFS transporter, NNP family, nitrate/nitrite transporter
MSTPRDAHKVLIASTSGFTALFAVWLMFGILGKPIQRELGLTDTQFAWLGAIPILNGCLWRLPFGVLADRWGGRRLFIGLLLFTAIPCTLVAFAHSFTALLALGFMLGIAGNSFSVGIAWNSAWFPRERQGFALGTFGAGNVGASLTKLIGPALIALVPAAGVLGGVIPGGWRFIPILYAVMLVAMAAWLWLGTPRDTVRTTPPAITTALTPLRELRVWRFGLYYVVVFGAYVALSLWLPKYYVDVYQLPLGTAGLLTCLFVFPASLLRPLGGWLSDRFGARPVMYGVFAAMIAALIPLALPLSVVPFTALIIVVGVAMGVGKAAVFKYIPEYFPRHIGAVGGLVGMIGGLGGFILPPTFAAVQKATGSPQSTFLTLLAVVVVSLIWLHVVVSSILRQREQPADLELQA